MLIILSAVQCGEQINFLRNRLPEISFNVLGGKMCNIPIFHLWFIKLLLYFVLGFITDRKEGDLEESCSSCSPKMKNRTFWTVKKSESQDSFAVKNVGYFGGLLSVSHPNSNILELILTIVWHYFLFPHFCRTNSFLLCFRLNAPRLSKYFWTKL